MVKVDLRTCLISIFLVAALCPATSGKIIYVDDDAAGTNDGTNWANAYTFLQDALADANSAEKPVEIRVARGIYKPDQGANQTDGDREATFQLINGVSLNGGYAGFGETDPNDRDIYAYQTILNGDLNSDDVVVSNPSNLLGEPNRVDNSYHVVIGSGTDETAILDGFTITGGNADIFPAHGEGGGIYNAVGSPRLTDCTFYANSAYWIGGGMANVWKSSPILTNCTFSGNSSNFGGGMYNMWGSSPILTNCAFNGNSVKGYFADGGGMANEDNSNPSIIKCTFYGNSANNGGAIYNSSSSPILSDCKFSENLAEIGGGIANDSESDPILTNCTFSRNSAGIGGGMSNWGNNPTLINCTFNGNSAKSGGGMEIFESHPTINDCIFSGNSADEDGGGICNLADGNPTLTNCTFSGNKAKAGWGGGMFNLGATATLANCTFSGNTGSSAGGLSTISAEVTVINSILWGNTSTEIFGKAAVSYSDVRGGFPGEGNIDVDPLFADGGYWVDVNDPNITFEPNDPNAVWIDGDYHLKSEAGRWSPVSESWIVDDVTSPCIDAGDPNNSIGDEPEPNGGRVNMGACGGTAEASMSPTGTETIVYIQWLGHSTVKVWTDDCIVYVDPERVPESLHDATLVCVTHTHGDHYSPSDIAKVSNAETQFIAPPKVIDQYGRGLSIAPWQAMEFDIVNIKAVPAYNIIKLNHHKSDNWVGFIIELGGKRIYVAGDTDLIDEMKSLGDIDVAFLPAGGTYTMNATEAAEATEHIKPDLAIPYHWGQSVGTLADAQRFVELARCPAMVLTVGEMISSDNWPEYSPLIAHWALDEAEGDIAHDSAGENHGTLSGDPAWQPAGGKIDGALQFDGIDDYVSTNFVLDPADHAFSVFAWIKGGSPDQIIISQADILAGRSVKPGSVWLGVDPSDGKLMTLLGVANAGSPIPPPPFLKSESVITDGEWHHIGVVITVSQSMHFRNLYLDGARVAMDTESVDLLSSNGGLNIGAGRNLEAGTFFAGLIDDVRIYNAALTADEIETLAH